MLVKRQTIKKIFKEAKKDDKRINCSKQKVNIIGWVGLQNWPMVLFVLLLHVLNLIHENNQDLFRYWFLHQIPFWCIFFLLTSHFHSLIILLKVMLVHKSNWDNNNKFITQWTNLFLTLMPFCPSNYRIFCFVKRVVRCCS